jgi:UDP-glucuronate 4-epimerase
MKINKILVTGAAGFIGYHIANRFCKEGHKVIGIDNINDYYDKNLKLKRIDLLKEYKTFTFRKIDICCKAELDDIFSNEKFDIVVNLAAQAGVRYSIDKPYNYIDSNLIGFINILEACRNYPVKHLFFASSSSVYGENKEIPFSTEQKTDKPVSLYGATKKANELMAYCYSHLYGIQTTGLRFFTVYGPWGRPDMAYFLFTRNILDGKTIKLFNHGKMRRDFTFVDDVVEGIYKLMSHLSVQDYNWAAGEAPFRIFNIGNHKPVEMLEFINVLEKTLGIKAKIDFYPMQAGDVLETYADIEPLKELTGFVPIINIQEGLSKFTAWYKSYYLNV